MLRTIRDPEKPSTLEDLKVVYEEGIFVQPPTSDDVQVVISLSLFLSMSCLGFFEYFLKKTIEKFSIKFFLFSLHILNQVRVEFNPTVPHCSLATLIGLCLRIKIERNIPHKLKLDIYIKKGAHSTEEESEYLCHFYVLSFSIFPCISIHKHYCVNYVVRFQTIIPSFTLVKLD